MNKKEKSDTFLNIIFQWFYSVENIFFFGQL